MRKILVAFVQWKKKLSIVYNFNYCRAVSTEEFLWSLCMSDMSVETASLLHGDAEENSLTSITSVLPEVGVTSFAVVLVSVCFRSVFAWRILPASTTAVASTPGVHDLGLFAAVSSLVNSWIGRRNPVEQKKKYFFQNNCTFSIRYDFNIFKSIIVETRGIMCHT